MNRVSHSTSVETLVTATNRTATPPGNPSLEDAFQDFVAGTFYREMLKARRSGQGKPAYFDGGMSERIFQGQMDQQVAEELAASHGETFSGPLFSAASTRLNRTAAD